MAVETITLPKLPCTIRLLDLELDENTDVQKTLFSKFKHN